MENIQVILDTANKFLKNHIFTIENAFMIPKANLDVKIKLLKIKDYVSVGELKPFIQYELQILDQKDDFLNNFIHRLMRNEKEITIDTKNTSFYTERIKLEPEVKNFLNHFSIEYPLICTKVINKRFDDNQINESLIYEGVYDLAVRQVVKDIISLFKYQRDGEFSLPDDLYENEESYNFRKLPTDFNVEVIAKQDENVYPYELDANYYRDEDVIEVIIISSPDIMEKELSDLVKDLNELIRHEFEHMSQYYRDYYFPDEPENNFDYYSQKHELEAQFAGFRRRAKKEKRTIEDVAREWFGKNQSKHGLNRDEIEKVIKKIISLKNNGR